MLIVGAKLVYFHTKRKNFDAHHSPREPLISCLPHAHKTIYSRILSQIVSRSQPSTLITSYPNHSNIMGKSASKIRRNQIRAAARGETYTPPPKPKDSEASDTEDEEVIKIKLAAAETLTKALSQLEQNPDNLNSKDRRTAKRTAEAIAAEDSGCAAEELLAWHAQFIKKRKTGKTHQLSEEDHAKLTSAKKLKEAIATLESDEAMNAKERRSAKRKAEAIAVEETGCEVSDLLKWYETVHPTKEKKQQSNATPYILFVGQLAYSTTPDMLFNHFRTTLGNEIITSETLKIRLLTDPKTKKSRGMGFAELSTPEIMYECLKMHLTHLDGRRINVERSAGGGAAAKKSKITHYREKQSHFISETMDKIISNHIDNGDIGQEELDEGVIALCKRHSAVVVEQALQEYVQEKKVRRERKETLGEKEEEELRNPSAFLTHMIGRVAEEGVGDSNKNKGRTADSSSKRKKNSDSKNDSILEKSGVDMSISHAAVDGSSKIASIFPSSQRGRGRGRGRGYM